MADWNAALTDWLKPFVEKLGHKKRRQMCPLYVAGLIGSGERKSIAPMAARIAPDGYDRLHHFISDGIWDLEPIEAELAWQADKLIGGSDAYLVIDDTSLPKKGEHSVGVAPQYASMLGKRANCQTLVSLTLARDEVPIAVGLRLFLPESWTSDPLRMATAGVPEAFRRPRSKPEIALEEIDRLTAAGGRFGAVLADAGYGLSAPFRQGLSARGLAWAVGVPKHQKVYPANVSLIFPVAARGRPRKNQIPDQLSVAAETILAKAKWKKISWRRGIKGPLSARFAALRIRIADGPKLANSVAEEAAKHPGKPIEVFATDEHRIGLKPITRRVWAPLGERPIAHGHHRFDWLYVTAFVSPATGETFWYVSNGVSKEFFEALLETFAREAEAGLSRIILLVLDNAGWHGPANLKIPDGVRLIYLPPSSPELQPAETLWALVDEPIVNQHIATITDLDEKIAAQCIALSEQREQIQSRTGFHWWPKRIAPN